MARKPAARSPRSERARQAGQAATGSVKKVLEADVVVAGGGPAGAAAAITLARAGREVVVVDRAQFPRDKCCGDGLTAGALRHYEALGLRPALVPSWQVVDDVVVRSPSGWIGYCWKTCCARKS